MKSWILWFSLLILWILSILISLSVHAYEYYDNFDNVLPLDFAEYESVVGSTAISIDRITNERVESVTDGNWGYAGLNYTNTSSLTSLNVTFKFDEISSANALTNLVGISYAPVTSLIDNRVQPTNGFEIILDNNRLEAQKCIAGTCNTFDWTGVQIGTNTIFYGRMIINNTNFTFQYDNNEDFSSPTETFSTLLTTLEFQKFKHVLYGGTSIGAPMSSWLDNFNMSNNDALPVGSSIVSITNNLTSPNTCTLNNNCTLLLVTNSTDINTTSWTGTTPDGTLISFSEKNNLNASFLPLLSGIYNFSASIKDTLNFTANATFNATIFDNVSDIGDIIYATNNSQYILYLNLTGTKGYNFTSLLIDITLSTNDTITILANANQTTMSNEAVDDNWGTSTTITTSEYLNYSVPQFSTASLKYKANIEFANKVYCLSNIAWNEIEYSGFNGTHHVIIPSNCYNDSKIQIKISPYISCTGFCAISNPSLTFFEDELNYTTTGSSSGNVSLLMSANTLNNNSVEFVGNSTLYTTTIDLNATEANMWKDITQNITYLPIKFVFNTTGQFRILSTSTAKQDVYKPAILSNSVSSLTPYLTSTLTFDVTTQDNESGVQFCILELYKNDLVTPLFNLTANNNINEILSRQLSLATLGTGTLSWNKTTCYDAGNNSATNSSVNVNVTILQATTSPPGGGGSTIIISDTSKVLVLLKNNLSISVVPGMKYLDELEIKNVADKDVVLGILFNQELSSPNTKEWLVFNDNNADFAELKGWTLKNKGISENTFIRFSVVVPDGTLNGKYLLVYNIVDEDGGISHFVLTINVGENGFWNVIKGFWHDKIFGVSGLTITIIFAVCLLSIGAWRIVSNA